MSTDLVLVDDDSLTLEIVALNLRKTAICHELFEDPEQAMQHLITTTPGVLIVDFHMSTTNGVEFLNTLCEKKELGDCRVYLCSAIPPQRKDLEKLRYPRPAMLSKDQLFDRTGLLKIIEQSQDATTGRSCNKCGDSRQG